MAIERRDNDKQVEELRGDANAVEAKVRHVFYSDTDQHLPDTSDGRAPEKKRGRTQ